MSVSFNQILIILILLLLCFSDLSKISKNILVNISTFKKSIRKTFIKKN